MQGFLLGEGGTGRLDDGTEQDDRCTVFFSYSRVDLDAARPLITLLENAGFKTWWDGILGAGVQYVETTEEALETACAVVVLWSARSTGSNWVRDEAMSGRSRNCLIPISLDGTIAPLGFRQFQALDFSGWNGSPDAPVARELLRAVAALHGREALSPSPQAAPAVIQTSRRNLIYLGLGGVVAIGGGFAAFSYITSGNADDERNSIIVLPFRNDSPDGAQDYVANGIATELRSMLARNPALRVIARSTSEAMMERSEDAVAIARELDVVYIVEGSVRVVDNIARISLDLIDGASGIGRWSETYSQPLDQLLDLQDQLASAISAQLSLRITDGGQALALGGATVPAAYDDYLRGWDAYLAADSHEDYLGVLALFENAARQDPPFAGAWAGQAAALTSLGHTAYSTQDSARFYARAQAAAQKAIEAGPDYGEAHSLLGVILFETQLKPRDAALSYERSVELEPGSAVIQARYAEFAALTGRDDEALRAIATGLNLDPLNPTIYKAAALVHYSARRFDHAIELHRRALSLNPQLSGSHAFVASAKVATGDIDGAIEAGRAEPFALLRMPCLAIAEHLAGNEGSAQQAMTELVDRYGDAGLYQQAQVLAQWDQPEDAMAKLARASELGDAGLTYLRIDPMLDHLRERPDFIDLKQRLGFT